MASITKSNGTWLAQVRRKGVSKSKRFRSKTEATLWAAKIEADLNAHARGELPNYTLSDAFDKYLSEVVPLHRSCRAEASMIACIKRGVLPINRALHLITSADIARWRDARCAEVSDGSVNRELTVIKSVFSLALKEWGWIKENPCVTVKKRPQPKHRDRLISKSERDSILHKLQKKDRGIKHQTRVAFELALETGMRLGEIVGLSVDDVSGRVAHLHITKNGSSRDVPLSKRALALLGEIERDGVFFTARVSSISHEFTKAVKRAGIADLRFHDTRHQAITDLAKKLSVLELARMIGHRDLKSLMIYYNECAESIADRLD